RDDPAYADKAVRIAALSRDVSELVAELANGTAGILPALLRAGRPRSQTQSLRVAYHSACSLQHGQGIERQPKELLAAAGFTVVDVPEGHLCCGSAGTYNLLQPALASALRERKLANL